MIIERYRRRANRRIYPNIFWAYDWRARVRVKAFKLDAPPHHPVQEAPFEPVDECFRIADWRTRIPGSLLAAKVCGVSWRTT